ncbi:hypothetical protein SAMN04487843_1167 [Methylobacterium sp. ap11]|uniref:NACHT domain-containing protein n=1 Tax=Methylobacterium sp. ap11 TaxID=1761799 RepID=UPI0008B0B103|nr:hypothetical protein [Methylobacterium sp. ap11]SEP40639.1 hypothetical protein SAMN04487843_1167 [Methylobacterium sp. ap11]
MTYDFSRFSTQSFEKFIQSLAVAKFGLSTQIFGAGKDGAREATFEGNFSLNKSEQWSGYVVVQAKFHENVGKSPENAAWLIRQIDAEMDKFANPKRSLRRPDYYIIATNTRLSAAAAASDGKGEGGIDRVEKHLATRSKNLGIKSCVLWHQDSLSVILESEPQVRLNYNFFITPGDVLSAALSHFKGQPIESYLPRYLRSQIRKSRDIKTKDAGQTTGKRIVLDEIFVDLPIDISSLLDDFEMIDFDDEIISVDGVETETHDDETSDENFDEVDFEDIEYDQSEDNRIVRSIVERCADKFSVDLESVESQNRPRDRNRVVLMGGPGQGKSTISQYIAQIYRARLIEKQIGNTPEIRDIVRSVLSRAEHENIPLTGPARFPFLIDLPAYADILSKNTGHHEEYSILDHARAAINGGSEGVTRTAVLDWLSVAPTIFILDGLDEIPHSGNRSDVIEAINELVDSIYEFKSDTFILVTSRPQGYQYELSQKNWSHWHMADLSTEDALRFGQQLANILVSDDIRRQEIVDNLAHASKLEATAPLMTSPLQVSLLFALVETRNNIPKDRWTLFIRYYEILRDREISKGGENGRLIGEYRSEIDWLHYEVGYLLHLRGEKIGSANPFLQPDEFANLIRDTLSRSGYDVELEALTERIVLLATTRLVFLRCRTAHQIAFDVRSLQEFMAAARIMASPQDKIRKRLKEIAGMSHWLHVFKIACSKVYSSAELESMRDDVLAILDSLNAGDRTNEDSIVASGSLLAAQMLADGVPGTAPASKRNLMARALNILGTPNVDACYIIEKIIDQSTIKVIQSNISKIIISGGDYSKFNVIRLLILMEKSKDMLIKQWASSQLNAYIADDPLELLQIINSRKLIPVNEALSSKLRDALWSTSIVDARRWSYNIAASDKTHPNTADIYEAIGLAEAPVSHARLCLSDGSPTDAVYIFKKLSEVISIQDPPPFAHSDWIIMARVQKFSQDPDKDNLIDCIKLIISLNPSKLPLAEFPWILLSALSLRALSAESADFMALILDEKFGSRSDWEAKESKWIKEGVEVDRFMPSDEDISIFPAEFLRPVMKVARKNYEFRSQRTQDIVNYLLFFRKNHSVNRHVADNFLIWYLRSRDVTAITWDLLEFLKSKLVNKHNITSFHNLYFALIRMLRNHHSNEDIISLVKQIVIGHDLIINLDSSWYKKFVDIYLEDCSRRFMLVLIVACIHNSRYRPFDLGWVYETDLNIMDDDTGAIKEAISVLLLAAGVGFDASYVKNTPVSVIKYLTDHPPAGRTRLAYSIRNLCLHRYNSNATNKADIETCYKVLLEETEKTKSRLLEVDIYNDLMLPRPI